MGIHLISLIVRDYDEAIGFFVDKLGFDLIEDKPETTSHSNKPKRWVMIRPPNDPDSAKILLARAEGEIQEAAIGRQWADRVGLFWQVTDFETTYMKMETAGVKFFGSPRSEPYGQVVVFEDIAGNKWDLLGPVQA